jgi:hypothetical protein
MTKRLIKGRFLNRLAETGYVPSLIEIAQNLGTESTVEVTGLKRGSNITPKRKKRRK